MTCKCGSTRIISVCGKTSDCFSASCGEVEHNGYVPGNIGLGHDSDYIEFKYCADCGQMQGRFPVTLKEGQE